ncbi:MAG: SurA N-terminal domain-containing protein [Desulfobacteraceae bacterium]|nr:SurA N-terminal domain-containing protein [Desulfobacteraceae bacterium]
MLRYLRDRTGSWIIKIILGLIIIIFAFFFGVGGFGPKAQGPVAMVNDQAISFNEYKESYESIVKQIRMRAGDDFDEKMLEQENAKQNALDVLIADKLVAIASEKFEVKVSEKELTDLLNGYSAFKTGDNFNFDQYKRVLAANAMTPEMFEFSQRKLLKHQKVRDLIFDNVMISDMEILKWYKYSTAQVSINYVKFNPSEYTKINPSSEDVRAFYDENKDEYKTDITLKVEYLKFSFQDYKDKIQITEKELKQYYENDSQQYSVPEKVEARHILIKVDQGSDADTIEKAKKEALKVYDMAIKGGNDFAELAKKYSQGPSNANGGYLGSFAKGEMVAPFSEKAFSMEPGEVSEPVQTQFGWHIIKVVAKFEPFVKAFTDVKTEIEKKVLEKKIIDLAYYDAGDAFDAVVDGDSLEQAGLITQRKVLTAGPFSKDGKGIDFKNRNKFAEAAFSTVISEISDIQEIENSYYLIKPIESIEPEIIKFDDIQDKVKADLLTKLKNEKAGKIAEAMLLSLKENNSLVETAKKQNVKIESSELFGRRGYIPEIGYAPIIVEAAFKLGKKDEIYPQTLKMNDIFYIISLKERSVPKDFKDPKEKEQIKSQLEDIKKDRVYTAWIKELKETNEIKILIPELFE